MDFRILGPLEVAAGGRSLALGSRKERLLLAVLLCRPNLVISSDQLVDALWSSHPPESALPNLRIYVHRLRQLFGADRIASRRNGYLLHVGPGELDADRFDHDVQSARAALEAADPIAAIELLDQALAGWRGAPFADLDREPALQTAVDRLAQSRLDAIELRIDAGLALGEHSGMIAELTRLAAAHPFRERFHAQLMLALYRAGRRHEALEVYRRARGVLVAELGIEPGAELARLEQAILRSDPGLELGRLWVPGAGGSAAEPPAPTVPATTAPGPVPAQLPAGLADFVGRAAHLHRLDEVAAPRPDRPGARLILITGTAGVGKTALAVRWAHRIAASFPDGQLYVNLRGYDTARPMRPIEALARFLRALGSESGQVPVELDEAAAAYRSMLAGRRVLIVLDNAAAADQVRPLLPGEARCLVLVTSRDQLSGLVATEAAQRVALGPLEHGEALDLLAGIAGGERVATEPRAATELAQVCAGLPLALRIAATHLALNPARPMQAYLVELRSGDPVGRLRIEGDESTAVGVAFARSYDTLRPETQRMFRLLGLLPGPDLTVAAAGALAGAEPAVATGLIRRLTAAHLVEEHAPGRYVLHDLLREYARERAISTDDPAERAAATERLYGFYCTRTEAAVRALAPEILRLPSAYPRLDGSEAFDRDAALAWLDAERTNLLAAIDQASLVAHQAAWLLADGLRGYFWLRKNSVDWLRAAGAGAAAAQAAGDLTAQAASALGLGLALQGTGSNELAIAENNRAAELARAAGWLEGEAAALGNLGIAYAESGQPHRAVECYRQALELNRRAGRRIGEAVTLSNLGNLCRDSGRLEEAAAYFAEALTVHRSLGTAASLSIALCALSDVHRLLGRFEPAEAAVIEALELARQLHSHDGESIALHNLAAIHRDQGNHAEALANALAALEIIERGDDRYAKAMAYCTYASIQVRGGAGPADQAAEFFRRGLAMARQCGGGYPEGVALLGLAELALAAGDVATAARFGAEAFTLARGSDYRLLEAQALGVMAQVRIAEGQPDRARRLAERALAWYQQIGHPLGAAHATELLTGLAGLATARR